MPDEYAAAPARARRRPAARPGALLAVLLVLLAVVAAAVLLLRPGGESAGPAAPVLPDPVPAGGNVFVGAPLHAAPDPRLARAAEEAGTGGDAGPAAVLRRLAQVPQGIWLTPESQPPGEAGEFVAEVVRDADAGGEVPVLVVYGVPDRDCTGGFSSGGLGAGDYLPWVQEIATAAARAARVAVVLEPDALASAGSCPRGERRLALLAGAVDALREAGVPTYVDGGHSHWVAPREVARLLREVGVGSIRGFATNVSNYQSDEDERAYAEELSRLVGGAHYVIDSGRNGRGATDQWCNPPGRGLGQHPGAVDDGSRLDAYLWVKPPAESDGECGGGPPAGEVWPERAVGLATAAGW